jgi:hypothetical protein
MGKNLTVEIGSFVKIVLLSLDDNMIFGYLLKGFSFFFLQIILLIAKLTLVRSGLCESEIFSRIAGMFLIMFTLWEFLFPSTNCRKTKLCKLTLLSVSSILDVGAVGHQMSISRESLEILILAAGLLSAGFYYSVMKSIPIAILQRIETGVVLMIFWIALQLVLGLHTWQILDFFVIGFGFFLHKKIHQIQSKTQKIGIFILSAIPVKDE